MSKAILAARLQYDGGDQLGRINKQKLNSLRSALKNSYQSRMIEVPNNSAWSCLINTSNLKPDYDKKILSVEFDSGLEAGDVFRVLDDDTHWMVYLPILTETAYLKSEIIRCRYQLDIDGEKYWVYFQGPTETDLRWNLKNGISYNELNLSGTVYIKNTPKTKSFLKRFGHLKIDGHIWEIQVTDSITVPGIIELEVQEYFDNPIEELPEVVKTDCLAQIVGKTTVKQDNIYGYEIEEKYYNPNFSWSVEGNPRVKVEEVYADGRICKVKVYDGAIRGFTLLYGNRNSGYKLDVKIDISKNYIIGSQEVYPYDTVEYSVKNDSGTFWIESDKATILETSDNYCLIEIVSGKKDSFNLYFKSEKSGKNYSLPIKILSL